jgi:serine/threonine protein kinase
LKPQNILISKEGVVKIADFGLGRIACHPFATFSREIETLWYRSPELLLGTQNYGYAVDLWSVGCILYDLVEGRALFQG